jgi:hypothetical protein
MPARLAYPFLYAECVAGVDDARRLEVDALLGDDGAAAELQVIRREAFEQMEAEIG